MIGKTISHYEILEKLGEGGMGVVYKARDLKLPRNVALKFLPPHLSSDENAKKRFIHEAEAASALDHPNIGTIYEIDETPDGQMFIAMACYEGQTLKQKSAGGAMGIDEAIDFVSQIASGLAKAHESDIFHRDIKPANVLLTGDGHAKIVDFGLAKLAGQTRVTRTGTTVGTVSYMSPEQARGDDVDARSDVFSAGVVLYELLTGKMPFRGDHEAAVIYSITNVDPEPLAAHKEDLPQGAQRVVDKALAKDRDERYASASDLLADLKKLREGRHVAALERRATKKVGRRVAIYAALAIVVVVAAGYAFLSYLERREKMVSSEPTSAISRTVVAVLPFLGRGGDELANQGKDVAEMLSTRLDGAGTFQCVDSGTLLDYTGQHQGDSMGPEFGHVVADQFGAGRFILGNIMDVNGQLLISAAIYRAGDHSEPPFKTTVQGRREDLLTLVDDLAAQIVIDQLGGIAGFAFDPDALTTRVYPALKSFFEGEARIRAAETSGPSFRKSVEQDSTFALPLYRLAVSRWWTMQNVVVARNAIDQALRHSQDLPERERLRLRAFRAELHEEDEDAEQLYRTIVSNYPEDYEAWLHLGTTQLFSCLRRGVAPSVAREALERTLVLDPDSWQSYYHITVLSLFERDYERFEALIRARWPDGNVPMRYRANLVFAVGDREEREQVLSELRDGNESQLMWSASRIALYTDDPVRSQDVARLMTDPVRSNEVRGLGHILLAFLEAAKGRWNAAAEEFQAAEGFNPAVAVEFRALVAAMPFLAVPAADLAAIRDDLDSWDPLETQLSVSPQPWFSIYDDIHRHLRVYLLGLLSARLGEHEAALGYADDLERMKGPPHVSGLMRDYARGLRAQVAWQRGDTRAALDEIQQIEIMAPSRYRVWSPFYKESHERYLRAELLHELGRDEEALGWTSSFGLMFGFEFVYLAPLHLGRAQYFEKLGQTDAAARHYAMFVEYWQDCDEELRPLVDAARARLIVLNGTGQ